MIFSLAGAVDQISGFWAVSLPQLPRRAKVWAQKSHASRHPLEEAAPGPVHLHTDWGSYAKASGMIVWRPQWEEISHG
jgi:hypothetical protein